MNTIKRLLAITLVVITLALAAPTRLPVTGAKVAAQSGPCDVICFASPAQWAIRLVANPFNIPVGVIIIPGDNNNGGVLTTAPFKPFLILYILKPLNTLAVPTNPFLRLRRVFVAAQLSLLSGRFFKGEEPAIYNSALSCYGLTFAPFTLANGVTISPSTTLRVLLDQALIAVKTNNQADMTALAVILEQLTVGTCARFSF